MFHQSICDYGLKGLSTGERQKHKRQKYAFSNLEEIKKIEIAPAGFSQIFSESKHWKRCSPEWIGPFSLKIVQIGWTVLKL